jgi:hypothetical protein
MMLRRKVRLPYVPGFVTDSPLVSGLNQLASLPGTCCMKNAIIIPIFEDMLAYRFPPQ